MSEATMQTHVDAFQKYLGAAKVTKEHLVEDKFLGFIKWMSDNGKTEAAALDCLRGGVRQLCLQHAVPDPSSFRLLQKSAVPLSEQFLAGLAAGATLDSSDWAASTGHGIDDVHNLVKRLVSLDMAEAKPVEREAYNLTAEGEAVIANGTPEALLFATLPESGSMAKADLDKAMEAIGKGFSKIGFANAKRSGWISLKDGQVARAVTAIEDRDRASLQALQQQAAAGAVSMDKKVVSALIKRKLVVVKKRKHFAVAPGPKYAPTIVKQVSELTKEMLDDGSWRSASFKDYNFAAAGRVPASGALHPLLKVRREFRDIFLELGFEEMPTSRFVESSFWNFDALFQPQQHPARDAHDTFFLKRPANTLTLPEDYVARVKATHENGWETGSTGYVYDWKREESNKNILRTHTTAVSSRMLYALGQEYAKNKVFEPKKYFSIDRVFRNENLDATHLAEFHQIEGLVCDRNITLGHLIGMLQQFFHKMGIEKLRFKPAYNPYTEPSLEVFSWHDGLKKWVELGNSGVFRPEMLLPMGLPPDVGVIAWGLSLERPTMIRYGFNNIRDLIGHRISLSMIQNNPLCRLDK